MSAVRRLPAARRAQTVIWLQNWGSAPHCSSLKVTRHLLSADIHAEGHWEQGEQEMGQEGRGGPGQFPPPTSHQAAESPLTASREPSRCRALESAQQTSECLAVALERCLVRGIFSIHLEVKRDKGKIKAFTLLRYLPQGTAQRQRQDSLTLLISTVFLSSRSIL